MLRVNGESYEGLFFNNKFHGKGKFTFAPDDKLERKHYIGWFENGHFHGHGTVTFQNGDRYKARW